MEIKEQILNILYSCDRDGMESLIDYLNSSDYFTAPASTRFHLARVGGLAEHSLNVFNAYEHLFNLYFNNLDISNIDTIPYESMAIEALLHDFCKIGMYVKDSEVASGKQISYLQTLITKSTKDISVYIMGDQIDVGGVVCYLSKSLASDLIGWLKDGGDMPDLSPGYKSVEDKFMLGHGPRSVLRLKDFIKLSPAEEAAIYYHMGVWEHSGPGGLMCNKYFIDSMSLAKEKYPDVALLQLADRMASFKENWE